MEIGSFIELQFNKGLEFYKGTQNIARLNSGRAAIWHAFRLTGAAKIWLPYYQCDTVREFLLRKNVKINYYHIDKNFNPTDLAPTETDAVLLVNYFGIMSADRMKSLAQNYKNVIIDNSQAFFNTPIEGCLNVYSCRKFIGVPDGAYVIGKNAERFTNSYKQGFSSDTSLFLLQRIEYGCEGKAYQSRRLNEERIDTEDILKMSALTKTVLDGTDYSLIKLKRRQNFTMAAELFGAVNKINPLMYFNDFCVPMVYPLVIENEDLLNTLQAAKHFQGHWWSYLCEELPQNTFEHYISKYIIPVTIDQRYGEEDLEHIAKIILK